MSKHKISILKVEGNVKHQTIVLHQMFALNGVGVNGKFTSILVQNADTTLFLFNSDYKRTKIYGEEGPSQGSSAPGGGRAGQCVTSADCAPRVPYCSKLGYCHGGRLPFDEAQLEITVNIFTLSNVLSRYIPTYTTK